MSSWLVIAATAIVRRWTRLYTLPLNAATQRARRREIESDLWEFRHDRSRHETSEYMAFHLLVRAGLGASDDLLWICEQLPNHLYLPHLSTILRFAAVVLATSSLVVFASGPTLDPARILRVNVASNGWVAVATGQTQWTLVPTFAFTLTNVGDRSTSALQVNAVFYRTEPKHDGLGTAFSPVVGWHGLTAGATSRSLVLRAQGWTAIDVSQAVPHGAILDPSVADGRVKLFVQHEGRWTLLGDFPLHAQLIQP